MSITSRFYHLNTVRRAEAGLGDGTKYATGTGATVDQDAKTFVIAGLSIITDLGADANDLFNSMILYFPTTGNKYHVVDWVASSDTATVFETPDTVDTDACEFRLNIYEAASDADYPIHRVADGQLFTLWKGSAAAQAQEIQIALPNLIEDGGFESLAAGNLAAPWTAETTAWQVSAASPLIGSRMAVYTKGASNDHLKQNLVGTITKGKTYRILFKAQAVTDNPPGATLAITLQQRVGANKLIQAASTWQPTITTTAAWFENTITADFSTDLGELFINGLGSGGSWGSCTAIRIDEIYVYEDIAVDRLVALAHGFNNGEITSVYGCRCWPERTSFAYGNDASANLASAVDVDQTEPLIQTLTESNYPVWEIILTSATGITYEAGILFLGPTMAFTRQMNHPFDPGSEITVGTLLETEAGRDYYNKDFHRGGPYNLNFTNVDSTFYANLLAWWQEVGRDRFPFLFAFDETSEPENIKLVRNLSDWLFPYDPTLRGGTISLREVI
jgi:hypothetical protein